MDLSRLPDDCNGLGTPAGLVSIACNQKSNSCDLDLGLLRPAIKRSFYGKKEL